MVPNPFRSKYRSLQEKYPGTVSTTRPTTASRRPPSSHRHLGPRHNGPRAEAEREQDNGDPPPDQLAGVNHQL